MKDGQRLGDKRSSPTASLATAGFRHIPLEPESDYSDDQETSPRNGAGSKRKRPISVS